MDIEHVHLTQLARRVFPACLGLMDVGKDRATKVAEPSV